MIASDVPESYSSPTAMARALASYMVDARAIRREVLANFNTAPNIWTIDRMRAEYLRGKERPEEAPFKPHEGYWPADQAESLTKRNATFVAALRAERAMSKAANEFSNEKWRRVA